MLPNKFQEESNSPPLGEPEGARLLAIGSVWPEPMTTAAGNRMLQLLQAFLNHDHQITFASTASKTEYSHDLTALGIKEEQIQLNDAGFDAFVQGLRPDVVVFDRFMVEEQFGWRVAEACPSAIRILNTEDLHSLRDYRRQCLKAKLDWTTQGWLKTDKTKREIASIYRSDLTLLVSSFEQELLTKHLALDNDLLMYLPFMLDSINAKTIGKWPSFEERTGFISYGNGQHAPNVDSYRYLKERLWPRIRKELPKAQLHIYGAYLPQGIQQMHRVNEGFLVHGWAENLEEKVQKARVVLAPLRFGAGIKGKLAMAMQQGTPSVTTSVGREGMGAKDWPGAVADEDVHFVREALTFHRKETAWYEAQARGVALINSVYAKKPLQKAFMERLKDLKSTLKAHREKNFIGRMLHHQSMAATKYMGKWIEEKNTKK